MNINELFTSYQQKRNTCLNQDYFSSLLIMYPAALVAIADGKFSEFEKANLVSALKEAADGNELILCEMYSELCYLCYAEAEYKQTVLECIKTELETRPEIKLMILELMISTAESEQGISEIEKQKIDELKTILAI